jgi:hypothetical protein
VSLLLSRFHRQGLNPGSEVFLGALATFPVTHAEAAISQNVSHRKDSCLGRLRVSKTAVSIATRGAF